MTKLLILILMGITGWCFYTSKLPTEKKASRAAMFSIGIVASYLIVKKNQIK
jgi:hypothetical protein